MSLIQEHISWLPGKWIFMIPMTIAFISCSEDETSHVVPAIEAIIIDAVTSARLAGAEVQLLEWYEFLGRSYSRNKERTATDANGHFTISYKLNPKYNYSLYVSKDLYYDDDFPLPLPYKGNLVKFPVGYIRTHITNKIEKAKWININYSPVYMSQPIFRNGYTNVQIFSRAFRDTSFITSTVGGVSNKLEIKVNFTDYIPDEKIVKDTSVLTVRFDTIDVSITLF